MTLTVRPSSTSCVHCSPFLISCKVKDGLACLSLCLPSTDTASTAGEGWLGLITAQEGDLAEQACAELCDKLRPNTVALTDAFDIPDRVLNSALGGYDGNVYEALYEAAVRSPLNMAPDGTRIKTPKFWDSLREYVDTDFLAPAASGQGHAFLYQGVAAGSKL